MLFAITSIAHFERDHRPYYRKCKLKSVKKTKRPPTLTAFC